MTVESGLVDGRAVLVVRDTGPGLPEGLDVFQLFVTTKAQGTGPGPRASPSRSCSSTAGEIAAASEPGRGATFTVSLPVERPDEAGGDDA